MVMRDGASTLADDLARRLVEAHTDKPGVTQLAVHGPFGERDLNHHLGKHPVRAQALEADRFREWRRGERQPVEPRTKVEQQLRIEPGPDLPRKDEVVAFVVADEQRAETDADALRVGEAADDELLRRFAFHLE